MDPTQAINSLMALHSCASRMLFTLARNQPLDDESKGQIRMFPRIALALLIACDVRPGRAEMLHALDATAALIELNKKCTEILGDCARFRADYALAHHNTHILHTLTLELCSALNLEPK